MHIYHNSWKRSNKSRNSRNPCAYGPKYDIIFFIVLHRQRIIINQPSIHLNNRHTNNVYTPITMGLESYLLFPKMENKKWKILAACTVHITQEHTAKSHRRIVTKTTVIVKAKIDRHQKQVPHAQNFILVSG